MINFVKQVKKTIAIILESIDLDINTKNKQIKIDVENGSGGGNIDINMGNEKPEINFSYKKKNFES